MKLVENGFHSFKKAINIYKNLSTCDPNEYDYVLKDIILSLHHSIETLFKYIVSSENPYLIFSDLKKIFTAEIEDIHSNKDKKEASKLGNTIEFLDVVNRTIILKKIKITKSEYNVFKLLNDHRNDITHHEIIFDKDYMEHLLSKLFPLVYKILKENISELFNDGAAQTLIAEDIKAINDDFDNWSIRVLFECLNLYNKSRERTEYLNDNPKSKEAIYNKISSNSKRIEYISCPFCKEKTFFKRMAILREKNDLFTGKCEYCELKIDNEHAYFMLYSYSKPIDLEDFNIDFLSKNFSNILKRESPISESISFE
ncbi:hypothetical protein, partial [Paenibacillus polymyxa]|uniref:hypothetical protein n=1 Tax=Paenibacillus polymyxa TaxID=1406 RepID=UPI0011123B6F